jgi:hypothetical protein
MPTEDHIVDQLNAVLRRFMDPSEYASTEGFEDLPREAIGGWVVSCAGAVRRLAPPDSPHVVALDEALQDGYEPRKLARVASLVQALRDDYADGLLVELRSLLNAELFDDFLDMAAHLLETGYKDPAAVIVGSVLEQHLRKLADANGVAATRENGTAEMADKINADLAKVPVYGKTEQKQVTAWLGRRNEAAHGHYSSYDQHQVELFLEGVRGFVVRHPA